MKPQPSLGATVRAGGTLFRVWAPGAARIETVLEGGDGESAHRMHRVDGGYHEVEVGGAAAGTLYRYRVDGRGPYPDPASRSQPLGVHGPSAVVDPGGFRWSDSGWRGAALETLVLYELHVGAFTPEGTFRAAAARLPDLAELGVTAILLMPVGDFAGDRNWGYDGAAPFAPARCYGAPDDLRGLVDAAHGLGLAVFLDVVYNHFGPDGAYHGEFSASYHSARPGPWGASFNFDGPGSAGVRRYVVENAVCWISEYHVDGLRLDATHAIRDESPRHIVSVVAEAARNAGARAGRRVLVIAEDNRNVAAMVKPEPLGGLGLDAVWSDDFHHQVRRATAGDSDGWFRDFEGTTAGIATAVRDGWCFRGQRSSHYGGPRGTDPSGVPCARFVVYLQNHDMVGNRASGDRLSRALDPAVSRALTVLLLMLPETPLLFMGQEWGAHTPFHFFTDHRPDLGRTIAEGRRREFSAVASFAAAADRGLVPDPQAPATFESSRLAWAEREREPHSSLLRLHRRLLALRRESPALRSEPVAGQPSVAAAGPDALLLRRTAAAAELLAVVRLRGRGPVEVAPAAGAAWRQLLSTEDAPYAPDATPAVVDAAGARVEFARPGAVVLEHLPPEGTAGA